jgi:hypothetical protein
MNDTHLEQPDLDVRAAMAELTKTAGVLTNDQELRRLALEMAVRVYLKPENPDPDGIVGNAESFYFFLSDMLSEIYSASRPCP